LQLYNDILSDDCAEIRRKIRLLQKTPGWKVIVTNVLLHRSRIGLRTLEESTAIPSGVSVRDYSVRFSAYIDIIGLVAAKTKNDGIEFNRSFEAMSSSRKSESWRREKRKLQNVLRMK